MGGWAAVRTIPALMSVAEPIGNAPMNMLCAGWLSICGQTYIIDVLSACDNEQVDTRLTSGNITYRAIVHPAMRIQKTTFSMKKNMKNPRRTGLYDPPYGKAWASEERMPVPMHTVHHAHVKFLISSKG
jgi:hypothetical protein